MVLTNMGQHCGAREKSEEIGGGVSGTVYRVECGEFGRCTRSVRSDKMEAKVARIGAERILSTTESSMPS